VARLRYDPSGTLPLARLVCKWLVASAWLDYAMIHQARYNWLG
jgi:hypothetical protein